MIGLGLFPDAGPQGDGAPPAPAETHVFLLAGQSNGTDLGPWDGGADWPASVWQLERWDPLEATDVQSGSNLVPAASAGLIPAARPLHHHFRTPPGGFGWSLPFALAYLAQTPGAELVLVPCNHGGTGFSGGEWNPGDPLYEDAVLRVNTLMAAHPGYLFKGVLWHQGEQDANAGGAAVTQHPARLDRLIAGLRQDIAAAGPATPVVCGGMVADYVAGKANYEAVQASLAAVPARVAHTGFAPSTGTAGQVGGYGSIHFDAPSMRLMGPRYVTALGAAQANLPPAPEAGALGHWLLGADNPAHADLVAGLTLSEIGGVTADAAGHVTLPAAEGAGLDSGLPETSAFTLCAVARIDSADPTIVMGNFRTATAGHALFQTGGSLRGQSYVGGGQVIDSGAGGGGIWKFVALSLDAAGNRRLYIRGSGAAVEAADSVTRGTPSADTLGLGPLWFGNGSYANGFDAAEFVVFDSALGSAALAALHARSAARMAARGIVLG